jgi:hypothetical protein
MSSRRAARYQYQRFSTTLPYLPPFTSHGWKQVPEMIRPPLGKISVACRWIPKTPYAMVHSCCGAYLSVTYIKSKALDMYNICLVGSYWINYDKEGDHIRDHEGFCVLGVVAISPCLSKMWRSIVARDEKNRWQG